MGKENGFRFAFGPVNLGMPESFIEKNQFKTIKDSQKRKATQFLRLIDELGYNFVGISPFMSGLMCQVPISTSIAQANYLMAKHLNVMRSLPFGSVLSTVFGARNNRHLKTNLSVCYLDFVKEGDFEESDFENMILYSTTRKQKHEINMTIPEESF